MEIFNVVWSFSGYEGGIHNPRGSGVVPAGINSLLSTMKSVETDSPLLSPEDFFELRRGF
jgi:hypothetical protein